jgi:hypothetical protein
MRYERRDERLHEAASLLAHLGPLSLEPMLDALTGEPSPGQALALLRGLSWLGERVKSDSPLAELLLVRYLVDDQTDLREAASAATRLLPEARARFWLSKRLASETDPEVKKTLAEVLEFRQTHEARPSCTSESRSSQPLGARA